jgi:hypothetical protein
MDVPASIALHGESRDIISTQAIEREVRCVVRIGDTR